MLKNKRGLLLALCALLVILTSAVIFFSGIQKKEAGLPLDSQWLSGGNGWGTILLQLYKNNTAELTCDMMDGTYGLFKGAWEYSEEPVPRYMTVRFAAPYPFIATGNTTSKLEEGAYMFTIVRDGAGEHIEFSGLPLHKDRRKDKLVLPTRNIETKISDRFNVLGAQMNNDADLLEVTKKVLFTVDGKDRTEKRYSFSPLITWNYTVDPEGTEYIIYLVALPADPEGKGSARVWIRTDKDKKICSEPFRILSIDSAEIAISEFSLRLSSYWEKEAY